MNKDELLKLIATRGYNVYFGAKKHFATYDIVEKLPRAIALIGILIGMWQLWQPNFHYNALVSFLLVAASVYAYTITQYDAEKTRYNEVAIQLVQIYNELHNLYLTVKSSNATSFPNEEVRIQELMNRYYSVAMSKQIFLSHTIAHFKLFGESQIGWMDEQLHFTFWEDKLPKVYKLILWFLITALIICVVVCAVYFFWKKYAPYGG